MLRLGYDPIDAQRRGGTKMKLNKTILVVALSLVFLAIAAPSHAIPELRLTADGGAATVTIIDGGPGDLNPLAGAITFTGAVGVFDINTTFTLTKPLLGSAASPSMSLTSSDSTSATGGPHSLVVEFSETDFGPVNSAFHLGLNGGTTSGTVTYDAFLGPTNGIFSTTTLLGSVGPFPGPTFSGSASSSQLAVAAPFSLTERVTIGSITGPASTNFNATLAVPEPGLLLLLGTGLLGVGLLGLKLKR